MTLLNIKRQHWIMCLPIVNGINGRELPTSLAEVSGSYAVLERPPDAGRSRRGCGCAGDSGFQDLGQHCRQCRERGGDGRIVELPDALDEMRLKRAADLLPGGQIMFGKLGGYYRLAGAFLRGHLEKGLVERSLGDC